jgi:pimeloyl-ACP methyl ester carboxylesterase
MSALPVSSSPEPSPGLLVLPGWDDDGQQQFTALQGALQPKGWTCRRANLPDSDWPAPQREATSREDALRQALDDYYALSSSLNGGHAVVLGFSFGAYIGAYLAGARPVRGLVLRSPALYPDEDWSTPKEDLDKRDLVEYRQRPHAPSENSALACCARFEGDVLLVDSERDQVIPSPVIASYEAAFLRARSVTRYTLEAADHQLSDPRWQLAYLGVVLRWLDDAGIL